MLPKMNLDYFKGEDIKKDYFKSQLVDSLLEGEIVRSAGGRFQVYLPPKLGFCFGVTRAIRMALYAAEKYAGRRIFLLNEMIHNPFINAEMQRRGVQILENVTPQGEGLEGIRPEDVFLIPAFGGTQAVYQKLAEIGCTVVDTTCGEVMSIWKRLQKYNEGGYTSLVYGKYKHEETLATTSRARHYLVIKDLAEAQQVADFVRSPNPDAGADLLARFKEAASPGFDPLKDLQKVGMASQTTMYASEFISASEMIRAALVERFGASDIDDHFLELNTICQATQERQDAVNRLAPKMDVMVVVGGYNSSNTTHLAGIAARYTLTYQVNDRGKIGLQGIRGRANGSKEETFVCDWLPQKDVLRIGMTSGASTPDSILEQVMDEILALDGGRG